MTKTGLFLVGVAVVVLAYDLLQLLTGGWTISQTISKLGRESQAIPFLAGFVCGHFFWPIWGDKEGSKRGC